MSAADDVYYERKMVWTLANECLRTFELVAPAYNASRNGMTDLLTWDAPSICRRELERLVEYGITDGIIRPRAKT